MSGKSALHNVPLPPGQAVGMISSVLLDALRQARLPGRRMVHRAAGCVLLLIGSALTGWAVVERRRHSADEFDLERPPTLVTTGPYALSRHPMYVGWWLIHLGAGVLRGSAWVLLTVPSAVLAEHGPVVAEERQLAQAFGEQFSRYAERVPRYIPFALPANPK